MIHYVISDLHLGHKKILEFEPSRGPFVTTEEHDQEILRRWNAVVRPVDRVYVLGDVFFRKETFELVKQLTGQKILVLGNHDTYVPVTMLTEVFHKIFGVLQYEDCVMTHVPVHPSQLERYTLNIHGHVHSRSLDDRRYVNVSAEVLNLTPAPLKALIEERKVALTRRQQP